MDRDNWIPVEKEPPPFDTQVLVYCRIYGRYIGSYNKLDESSTWGNWHDGTSLGVLPPTHWMHLPEPPKKQ